MSVQKNAGFDFPMINGLLLFFSVIIHGKRKASDFECLMSDPELGNYETPIKRLIIEHGNDDGETVSLFLYRNFFVNKRKIYYVSNEFYLPEAGKKGWREYEHLRVLTGITRDELDCAVFERREIETADDDHRKKHLVDIAPNYRRRTKALVDAYFDPKKSKAFDVSGVTPVGYKLCHNMVNYVDHISPPEGSPQGDPRPGGGHHSPPGDNLFRFLEVIPTAMFGIFSPPLVYDKMVIGGYLEKHPYTVNQSWFGNELTYAQTEKMLNTMTARKVKLDDVFEDLCLDFEEAADTFVGTNSSKTPQESVTISCYIFIGEKYSGKSFIAKRFTEYLDDTVPRGASVDDPEGDPSAGSPVTILNEYKAKLNRAITEGKRYIIIDSPMLNKEYHRRSFKRDMIDKFGDWVTLRYVFVDVRIVNTFKNMLIKYTKAAYPTEFSASITPKGYFQCNPKGTNILDFTNCFWIDASRDTPDFSFEIGRQIH